MIMENYIHAVKVSLSILFIIVFSSCKKDPLRIVEEYSFLSIPKNAQVINFIDLENTRGEKVLFIDVKVTKENIEELTSEISDNKYKLLPIDDEIVTPEQNGAEIVKYLSKKMQDRFCYVNKYNIILPESWTRGLVKIKGIILLNHDKTIKTQIQCGL